MGIYRDKLCETVPVIKRVFQKKGEMIYVNIEIEKWAKDYYNIEYLKPVWENLESGEGGIGDKCYFLVTEEDSIGAKAAFAILNYPLYAGEIIREDKNSRDNYLSGQISNTRKSDKSLSYIASKNEYAGFLRSNETSGYAYFAGLDESDRNELELKLQCVMSCSSRIQFVQIKKEYLNRAWARELLKNRECEIMYLPKVKFSYYFKIMEMLLEGERYKMDSSVKMEQILRNIQKKCGNRFCEEDIAWSLDQAEKSAFARWDFRCLKAEDFKLDIYEQDSPMKKLDAMIGLEAMKTLAHEYAALGREQMRNEKLADICKHVLFVGKPGTGKTMCGELLSQIMSEQGQSNGNFILASRKDMIAEFVGQTAPKVAKLFSQARKGVLFVDEAGFFLHDTKDSFTQEAIKEFVRYMEMYQDVTVIFALYPGEVENWLKLDVGLTSRISRIIYFEDYSEQELLDIVERMCKDRGYYMSKEAVETIRSYLHKQRKDMGEEFGNAREGRKLVESAVIARSMRCYDMEELDKEPMLIVEDFEYGIKRLEQGMGQRQRILPIGFAAGGN